MPAHENSDILSSLFTSVSPASRIMSAFSRQLWNECVDIWFWSPESPSFILVLLSYNVRFCWGHISIFRTQVCIFLSLFKLLLPVSIAQANGCGLSCLICIFRDTSMVRWSLGSLKSHMIWLTRIACRFWTQACLKKRTHVCWQLPSCSPASYAMPDLFYSSAFCHPLIGCFFY